MITESPTSITRGVLPTSIFAAALCHLTGTLAAEEVVSISSDFPGGNIQVVRNEGTTVEVAPDLKGGRDWFYWYFEATARKPAEVTFRFPEKVAKFRNGAVGFQGPAVSEDGGKTWRWRGSNQDLTSQRQFTWKFTRANQSVRFAVTVPYTSADLETFMRKHRGNDHFQVSVLTKTRANREVPLFRIGTPGGTRTAVLITCRHHACETMASFLLEGFLDLALSDSAEGAAFRRRFVLYVVPLVDLDGVEEGDQGKNRLPHDHNRDYGEGSKFPSVQSIKRLGVEKGIRVLLDLHCPTLVMDIHQRFYFVGPSDVPPRNETMVEQFAKLIDAELPEEAPHGPVLQLKPTDKDRHKHCSGYFSKLPGALMSTTLETPYAPGKTDMSPDKVRAYGAAILRAWNRHEFEE